MYEDKKVEVNWGGVVKGCLGLFGVMVLFGVLLSIKTISPTEVAVVTQFGQTRGVQKEGVRLALFEGLTIYDKKAKTVTQKFDAGSKNGQYVYVTVAFNYSLKSDKVAELYSNIGNQQDLEDKLVTPTLQDVIKVATAQFTAEEILPKQNDFRDLAKKAVYERVNQDYITINDLSITNIDFTPEYNAAIEQKQIAQQNSEKNKFELEQQKNQSQVNLDKAKLDADTKRVAAQGDADAQNILRQSLTPEILAKMQIDKEMAAISKWNGVLPTTNAAGSVPFINLK